MQRLDKRIAEAVAKKEEALLNLRAMREQVQAECLHIRVAETHWKSLTFGGCLNARRICLSCGYEEEGSHWSGGHVWSEVEYNKPVLGNKEGRDILTVDDRDAFYKFRIS